MFYFILYVFAVLSAAAGVMHHPPLGQTLRWLAQRKPRRPHKLTETPTTPHHSPTWARTDYPA